MIDVEDSIADFIYVVNNSIYKFFFNENMQTAELRHSRNAAKKYHIKIENTTPFWTDGHDWHSYYFIERKRSGFYEEFARAYAFWQAKNTIEELINND